MPRHITDAVRRRRARQAVAYRKVAGTLEQMFARMRAKLAQAERGEDDQRPRMH